MRYHMSDSKKEKQEARRREKAQRRRQKQRERRQKQYDRQVKATTQTETALQKKESKRQARQSRIEKLKLVFSSGRGVSHKRFRSAFLFTGLGVVLMVGGAFTSYQTMLHHQYIDRITETIFSNNLAMSKSKTTVTIDKPRLSEDGRTAYIPIKFKDLTSLPSNAKDYSVFMFGTNGQMSYQATGQLIMYSNSGQAVLKVTSPTKIENEVVGLMIRSNKNLSDPTTSASSDQTTVETGLKNGSSGMETFLNKYDAVYFSVNLAGKSIKKDKKLNGETDVSYLYALFYANQKVDEVKAKIKENETNLKTYYKQADELISILQRDGYEVPTTPAVATPDGKPDLVYPVKLNSDVQTGFVDQKDVQSMTAIINQAGLDNNGSVSNDGTSGDRDQSGRGTTDPVNQTITIKGLGTLPINLKRNDGTTSGDVINRRQSSDGATSAADTWQKLTNLWTTIYQTKVDIYQTQALKLYSIELDFKDTLSSVTVGRSNQFKQFGRVKGVRQKPSNSKKNVSKTNEKIASKASSSAKK